ncbi:hypothetical protein NW768_006549 [Fusarium equiseti]|uniref:Uncharacterized protein n=1 Tax=Fusarium equiseti TaxID=61235 RepID=A0ABQ8RBS9_FUSEQ|nr:hypothetical protein NW768_006549 [Fusarium equiseti]
MADNPSNHGRGTGSRRSRGSTHLSTAMPSNWDPSCSCDSTRSGTAMPDGWESSRSQKQKLGELVRMAAAAADPDVKPTTEDFQAFLSSVFVNWHFDSPVEDDPSFPAVAFRETRVEVGILKKAAPSNRANASVRAAEQPVYCGVNLSYDTEGIHFTYQDANGTSIPYDLIELKPGWNHAHMRYMAITNYDSQLSRCVRRYNSALIVTCARRSIKKWAKYGTLEDPDIEPDDMPRAFMNCKLASRHAGNECNSWMEVVRLLGNDRVASGRDVAFSPENFS